jgi:hypothetical protein
VSGQLCWKRYLPAHQLGLQRSSRGQAGCAETKGSDLGQILKRNGLYVYGSRSDSNPVMSVSAKGQDPKKKAGALAPAITPSLGLALGSSRRRPVGVSRRPRYVNQDSPDPEGTVEHPEFQQLATLTRVRVTRCWSLPASMLDFAVLYSLRC